MPEYEFKKGSAFMRPPTEKEEDHLHIVLTNPLPDDKDNKIKVIMVNVTSIKVKSIVKNLCFKTRCSS